MHVCMCVCMRVCMHASMHAYMCAHLHVACVHMHAPAPVHVLACAYVCMPMSLKLLEHVNECLKELLRNGQNKRYAVWIRASVMQYFTETM